MKLKKGLKGEVLKSEDPRTPRAAVSLYTHYRIHADTRYSVWTLDTCNTHRYIGGATWIFILYHEAISTDDIICTSRYEVTLPSPQPPTCDGRNYATGCNLS